VRRETVLQFHSYQSVAMHDTDVSCNTLTALSTTVKTAAVCSGLLLHPAAPHPASSCCWYPSLIPMLWLLQPLLMLLLPLLVSRLLCLVNRSIRATQSLCCLLWRNVAAAASSFVAAAAECPHRLEWQ
jgi:hypothetical protein